MRMNYQYQKKQRVFTQNILFIRNIISITGEKMLDILNYPKFKQKVIASFQKIREDFDSLKNETYESVRFLGWHHKALEHRLNNLETRLERIENYLSVIAKH